MKLIYASILLLHVVRGEKEVKKTNARDVNDDVSGDYALTRIPVYLIQNTPPSSDGKVPVAVLPGAYPPGAFFNGPPKEAKPHKYGFYAPYKTPEVTPIHEPQSDVYAPQQKFQHAYAIADVNQKPDYNENPSYKVSVIGKDYQTSTSFVKYETTPKALLEKHQSLSNGNIYASLAPVVGYQHPDHQSAIGYGAPKKLAYDYQQQPPTQYYIKYVPVPYNVPQDQYAQNLPESAYITPKPFAYKATPKPALVQDVEASTASYPYASDSYQDTKYAASYAQPEDSYQYPEYKYVQPSSAYKYYDKNAYAKKYVPTSYLVASIGKGGSNTHYAANIQHSSVSLHEPAPYTTKLAPVPLPVDKYVVQDSQAPEENKYPENGYAYVYPSANTKYKPLFSVPQYNDYESQHYHKKDVQSSVSSTQSYESSTSKL